ncbi:MAG: hypothetical protein ACRD8W_22735 [Nitrososphaeraceae archaeon]
MPIPLANNIKNVYAGGPERDYDERYEDVPSANGSVPLQTGQHVKR